MLEALNYPTLIKTVRFRYHTKSIFQEFDESKKSFFSKQSILLQRTGLDLVVEGCPCVGKALHGGKQKVGSSIQQGRVG